jgi:hypothetical protein
MEQRIVIVQIKGIKMEITIWGNPDWESYKWEEEALIVIKGRLLQYWNAYCE